MVETHEQCNEGASHAACLHVDNVLGHTHHSDSNADLSTNSAINRGSDVDSEMVGRVN